MEIVREGAQTIVRPGTNIVASMAQDFRKELLSLVDGGEKSLVLDLTDVKMIDSIGIGMVVALHNSLSKAGGNLALVSVPEDIHRLFKAMRLDQYFDVKAQ